jgi:hypothetical protein
LAIAEHDGIPKCEVILEQHSIGKSMMKPQKKNPLNLEIKKFQKKYKKNTKID